MNKILLIGAGGCGGRLVDAGILQHKKSVYNDSENVYSTAIINSNSREMERLDCYAGADNALAVTGGGSARNKDDARASIMKESESFTRFLYQRIKSCNSVLILVGAAGGFGSAAAPAIANFIRSLDSEIFINMVAVMPEKTSNEKEFINASTFINDMQALLGLTDKTKGHPIINSYMYVNNNMMGDKGKDKFNAQIMKLVVESMELKGNVDLDQKDMLNINGAVGYKVILPLSSGLEMKDAINYSIDHSIFYMPDELKNKDFSNPIECKSLGVTLCEEDYSLQEVNNFFKVNSGLKKVDYGNSNFIVSTGLLQPKGYIDELKAIKEEKSAEAEAVTDEAVIIDVDSTSFGIKSAKEQNEERLKKMKTSTINLFF